MLNWACCYSGRCPFSFLFAQSLLLSGFCLDRTKPAAGGGQRVFSFFGWFRVSMQVFVLLLCEWKGLTDGTAGLRAGRCPVPSGWDPWKQGLELCNCCLLCVWKAEATLQPLIYLHHYLVVGFWLLSPSWGRRNGWLGSSHWLNICPLKGVALGWAGISQE